MSHLKIGLLCSRLIFLMTFISIALMLVDHNVVWVAPETIAWRRYLLNHETPSALAALMEFLNWEIMETAPRLTRPFSNLLEVLDTHLRSWFFLTFFPLPSMSVTWIFSLVGAPLLLWRCFKLMNLDPMYRFLGVSVYLSSPGPLSLLAMSFRPGKAMACFFFVLLFYLALKARTMASDGPGSARLRLQAMIVLTFFFSLFFDEIAVFGLVVVAMTVADHYREFAGLIVMLLVSLLAFFVVTTYGLPLVHRYAGFPITGSYKMQSAVLDLIFLQSAPEKYWKFAVTILENFRLVAKEFTTVALFGDRALSLWKLLPVVLILIALSLVPNLMRLLQASRRKISSDVVRYGLLLVIGILFHSLFTFAMHVSLGVYWYGVFLCLPWTLLLIAVLSGSLSGKKYEGLTANVVAGLIVIGSLKIFGATNYAYKYLHYYPYAPSIERIFDGNLERFELQRSLQNKWDLRALTGDFKTALAAGGRIPDLPAELSYLHAEFKLGKCRLSGDVPCTSFDR